MSLWYRFVGWYAKQLEPFAKLLALMVVTGWLTYITWPLVPVLLAIIGYLTVVFFAYRVGRQRRKGW